MRLLPLGCEAPRSRLDDALLPWDVPAVGAQAACLDGAPTSGAQGEGEATALVKAAAPWEAALPATRAPVTAAATAIARLPPGTSPCLSITLADMAMAGSGRRWEL